MDAATLGQQLREAREARELTLEDAEQALRIRKKYLVAFEAGDYADLPGAVQARGFLRNYAHYLNLDDEQVLAQFAAAQQADAPRRGLFNRAAETSQVGPVTVPHADADYTAGSGASHNGSPGGGSQGRRQARLLLGLVLGLVLIVACAIGGAFAVERVLNADANRGGVDLLSILPTQPSVTPSVVYQPSPTALAGALVEVGATPITGRVVLVIDVQQRSFLRVTSDGILAFEGIVSPGTQVQYQAQGTLNVQASNGSALEVIFNNIPLGQLGARGEAIDRTFTPDMVLTPTARPIPATATLSPPAEGAGESGKAGQGDVTSDTSDAASDAPTALPVPGGGDNAASGEPATPTALPDLSGAGDDPAAATALPSETSPATVTATLTPTATASATRTPTATATPSPTFTPSDTPTPTETPVLPPRQTSTPIIEKN